MDLIERFVLIMYECYFSMLLTFVSIMLSSNLKLTFLCPLSKEIFYGLSHTWLDIGFHSRSTSVIQGKKY